MSTALVGVVRNWNDVSCAVEYARTHGVEAFLNVAADVDDMEFVRMVMRLDGARPGTVSEVHRAQAIGTVGGVAISLGLLR